MEEKWLIIDAGCGNFKAGLSDYKTPQVIVPAIIGLPKHRRMVYEEEAPETFFGATIKMGLVKVQNLIEQGEVTDWGYMDSMLYYLYSECGLKKIKDQSLVFLQQPSIPSRERELYAELLFETQGLKRVLFASSSLGTFCTRNFPQAMIFDVGDSFSTAIAYSKGFPLKNTFMSVEMGGRDVTSELSRLMNLSGYRFETSAERNYIKYLKETACKVVSTGKEKHSHHVRSSSSSYMKDKDKFSLRKVQLPDGNHILFDDEWNKCFDILFTPAYSKTMSIQDMLHYGLMAIEIPYRKQFHSSVIVTGGTAQAQFFSKKLQEEYDSQYFNITTSLAKISPMDRLKLQLSESKEQTSEAWTGGNLISRTDMGKRAFVTKAEYEEFGSALVNSRYLL